MNRLKFFLITFFNCLTIFGQTPNELGFIKHSILDKKLGNIDFFITDSPAPARYYLKIQAFS